MANNSVDRPEKFNQCTGMTCWPVIKQGGDRKVTTASIQNLFLVRPLEKLI